MLSTMLSAPLDNEEKIEREKNRDSSHVYRAIAYVGHPISSATSLITWQRKMDYSSNIVIYLL